MSWHVMLSEWRLSATTDTSPGWVVPGSISYSGVEMLRAAQHDIISMTLREGLASKSTMMIGSEGWHGAGAGHGESRAGRVQV